MSKPTRSVLSALLALSLGGCAAHLQVNDKVYDFNLGGAKPTNAAPGPDTPPLLYAAFQDHEVLQRDKPIHVWGTAKPADTVKVMLAGETADATADASGKWEAVLAPLTAGGPFELTATSGSGRTQTNKDVMIGDVFFCSGQSNMEMPLRVVSNYDADLNAAANTNIRLMHVQRFASATARNTFGADVSWAVTSPDAVREFSAACYNFGKNLQPVVNVPVGLIEDSWGGSVIQTWISSEKVRELGGYEHQLAVMAEYTRDPEGSQKKWLEYTNSWWHDHDPGSNATPAWSDPAYDDSSWDQIVPAGWWEGWGVKSLSAFDGIVWLRKTITLTAAQAKGDAVLSLGAVDDIDTTWVNGIQVGGQEGWDTKRVYKVPAGTLHEGTNLIAVGVLDTGSGGGMWGKADEKNLKLADGTLIVMDTQWRYKISAPLSQTGGMAHAPWLKESGLSMLYNGMIGPVGPTAMRAAIWYQGESDTWQPKEYGRLLQALIEDWRHKFGTDLPFVIVQLPNFGPPGTKPGKSVWAEVREVQRNVANTTPNTGLAVTIDLGQTDNIHPTNKAELGRRLALVAERLVYGMNVADSGPTPVAAIRDRNTIAVSYAHIEKGLAVYESKRPVSFQVCDIAGLCEFVDATQRGNEIDLDISHLGDPASARVAKQRDKVINPDVPQIGKAATVRYCWADSPLCNVYNSENLPAVPFEIQITQAPQIGKQLVRKPRHHRLRGGKTGM